MIGICFKLKHFNKNLISANYLIRPRDKQLELRTSLDFMKKQPRLKDPLFLWRKISTLNYHKLVLHLTLIQWLFQALNSKRSCNKSIFHSMLESGTFKNQVIRHKKPWPFSQAVVTKLRRQSSLHNQMD